MFNTIVFLFYMINLNIKINFYFIPNIRYRGTYISIYTILYYIYICRPHDLPDAARDKRYNV